MHYHEDFSLIVVRFVVNNFVVGVLFVIVFFLFLACWELNWDNCVFEGPPLYVPFPVVVVG